MMMCVYRAGNYGDRADKRDGRGLLLLFITLHNTRGLIRTHAADMPYGE